MEGAQPGAIAMSNGGRHRLVAVAGPCSRIPVSPVSAIDRALRGADARLPGASIFTPRSGTVFDSAAEGYQFYNLYSWDIGFGIRFGRSRTNSQQYRTRQDIICACSGAGVDRHLASQRTGCMAMVRLLRTEDHGWYVSRFVEEHNHPLSECVGQRRQWNSHNRIDPIAKEFIRNLRTNNIPLSRLYGVLGTSLGGGHHAQFTRSSLRGVCARLSQESIVDDIGKTLSLLRGMQAQDTNLAVCIDSDHEGRVQSILWCTGKNRADYALFGDAITFDTTYRTNLYDMPFGLFVGVNQHFQSIVFGGVLLRKETTTSFEWAFSTFVAIMHGKAPLTMLTDQCAAMEGAIREVLPDTRHRWCRWHVLRKAKEKIGGVYSKYSGFKKEFHDVVTNVLDPGDFENAWAELRVKYKLTNNSYLDRIFDRRNIRYQAMLTAMAAEEAKEDHVTKQWSAAGVYTRVMFDKLSLELYASGSFIVQDAGTDGMFVVRRAVNNAGESVDATNDVSEVKYIMNSTTEKLECSCGLFEHMGMPCRHMLKVLVHQSATEIPAGNIHRRWTVAARSVGTNHAAIGGGLGLCADDVAGRKNLLYLAAMDLMHQGAISVQGFEASMQALSSAKHSLRVMSEDAYHVQDPIGAMSAPAEERQSNVLHSEVQELPILAPIKVKSRGRPASVRLKARADYYGNKRVKTRGIAECYVEDEASGPPKIADVAKSMGCGKRQAKCGKCGVTGHNRQTCGRV
ncbi:unnamed protein product [Urochloa decumbens]|uniref:Protein FAR1-RELATED SEQUENCE n=1 Tax=Urochloa decumbens TaxID=240449 RepID=A0ABC9DR74_9POAL